MEEGSESPQEAKQDAIKHCKEIRLAPGNKDDQEDQRKDSKKTKVSSIEDWDYNSSLARNISWDKHRRPNGRKEINKLYNVVTDNLKSYNDQSNEAIDNQPTFDNSSFTLSSGTSEHLPVVTVSLWVGNKQK